MSIHNNGLNRWLVRIRARRNGKMLSRQVIVTGGRKDAAKVELGFRDELARGIAGSLKIRTFGEALKYYRENTTATLHVVAPILNRLDRDLGVVPLPQLTDRFSIYWKLLREERSQRTGNLFMPATLNRLMMYGKVALNFCMRRGLVDKNPLVCFQRLPEQGRDRVLTEEESTRILEIMKRRGSYLYWPFYFSLRNPIRRGDLCRLTRKNLDWFKPWIHFHPSKTRNRKPRETCLPFIDGPLLDYLKALPAECEYLFPSVNREGSWLAMGDFKRAWHSVLQEARIEDFHWHDLKHCAITWMLDNGYTDRDLKNLGIQYSPAMIERYYHADANKVLTKWKAAGTADDATDAATARGCVGSFGGMVSVQG